jgi:16S rRNA (guanine527-N7)-methyltransferase
LDHPSDLIEVLEESKRLGFLGPGPVVDHIEHASQFVAPLDHLAGLRREKGPLRFVDLGAGGGLPSLPLLVARTGWRAVLLDASQKRCSFLVWAIVELGLSDRVEVWCGRAEEIAHEDRARFRFDAVVARGFGPPAATVECGAPLLTTGGWLVISEPPQGREWPSAGLAQVGVTEVEAESIGSAVAEWPGVVVLRRDGDVPSSFPRRPKVQQQRPLF